LNHGTFLHFCFYGRNGIESAIVPQQNFENSKGKELLLNEDYLGQKRDAQHTSADPLEIK